MRKRPTEVASVYEDTSYRRTVPKSVGGTSSGGGYYGSNQGASHHGGWYSGDYQSDFRSSHEYQDTVSDNLYYEEGPRDKSEEDSWVYRDIAFSDSDWSQRRQLKGLAPQEEEEEEEYYEY